ncbi:hypothetical protein [Herbiconiux sp.]|jgi:DnaJ-class molecular chaperone|uniref:hypothetical protein n=1 Tax=Herbiconiux sp. TaxID=1871186 RepID=UPI0025C0D031|nr:hypothetical protein [Herbiconiux sp.]
MNIFDTCERCDGSGADPRQSFFDDVVDLCGDCSGDGVLPSDRRHDEKRDQRHDELAGSRAA